jgi:hypothetical protein
MVNGADDVYVERRRPVERVPDGLFDGEEAVLHLIERTVSPLVIRVYESPLTGVRRRYAGPTPQSGAHSQYRAVSVTLRRPLPSRFIT